MTNVFLAYSSLDSNILESILNDLKLSKEDYDLWYYQPGKNDVSMEKISDVIAAMDIFLLLLTENSLSSSNVQEELKIAINEKRIKEICPISINNQLMKEAKMTIPEAIQNNTYYSNTVISATEIIEGILSKY